MCQFLKDFGITLHDAEFTDTFVHTAEGNHLEVLQFFREWGMSLDAVGRKIACVTGFLNVARHGNLGMFHMLKEWPDRRVHYAARVGKANVCQGLCKVCEPSGVALEEARVDIAFEEAALFGHVHICEAFIAWTVQCRGHFSWDILNCNRILKAAARHGYLSVFQLFTQHGFPANDARLEGVLEVAMECGHAHIAHHLKTVNPMFYLRVPPGE